jgi:hypothetical protein
MQRVRTAVRENRLSDPARIGSEEYARRLAPGASSRGWVADMPGCGVVGFAFVDALDGNVWALFVAAGGRAARSRTCAPRRRPNLAFSMQAVQVAWLTTAPGTRASVSIKRLAGALIGPVNGEVRLELEGALWCTRDRPELRRALGQSANPSGSMPVRPCPGIRPSKR